MRDFITDRKVAFKEYLTRPKTRVYLWATLYVVALAGWFVMVAGMAGASLWAWLVATAYFFVTMYVVMGKTMAARDRYRYDKVMEEIDQRSLM